jgi:cytoskeletal protein CcmA (bactofilin family)
MNTAEGPSASNKGFSLFLTLTIIIIISSLITTFLLINNLESWRLSKRINWEQAFYIASSGMTQSMKNPPHLEYENTDSLFGGYLTTEAKFKKGFMNIVTTGKFKNQEVSMLSEFGSELDSSISESGAILEIDKEPEIYGSIDGDIKTGHLLPELNSSIIKDKISLFLAYLQTPYQADTELFSPQLFYEKSDIPNKEIIYVNDAVFFRDGTFDYPKTIISTSDIIVENGVLKELTLIAYGEVRIQYDSELHNVSVFSPNSVILSGYSYFSGEIISQQEIRVAEYAKVAESSVLIGEGETNHIRFTESSSFSGTAISTAEKTIAGAHRNAITIEKYARCRGLIYSSGKVSVKGELEGLICAHSFYGRISSGPSRSHYGNAIEGDIISGIPEAIVPSAYIKTQKFKRKTWKLIGKR